MKLDGEAVVILKEGKEVTIPFSQLAQASIAQAKSLGDGASTADAIAFSPQNLLGKTMEECERVLGPPVSTETPNGDNRSISRKYKSPIPGCSLIKLARLPEGSTSGTVSATVNRVFYYFPKDTIKTFGQVCSKIGMTPGDQEPLNESLHLEIEKGVFQPLGFKTKEGLSVTWIPVGVNPKSAPGRESIEEDELSVKAPFRK